MTPEPFFFSRAARSRPCGLTVRVALRALLLLITAAPALPAQGPPPAPVRVQPVVRQVVEDLVLVTGDLRAVQRSALASQEAGLVIALPVREGMVVSEGDVIARLDPMRLTQERNSLVAIRAATEAERQQRVAELEMRARDVETLVELTKKNVTNPKELADAHSEVKIAEAQLARVVANLADADARLALQDRRLADLEIRAPFAGTVVARHIDLGEWITPGTATVELVSTGSVEVWLNVPEEHRGALAASLAGGGGGLHVRVDAVGRTFSAPSPRVIPNVDRTSRNFPLVVAIPDPFGLLIPGMSATAYIPTGRGGEHLLVKKDAILRGTTGPYIYIAKQLGPDSPQKAIPMPVRILFPSGENVAVEAPGLQPGDLAVVEGNERLFPTAPVAPSIGNRAKAEAPLESSETADRSRRSGKPGGTDR